MDKDVIIKEAVDKAYYRLTSIIEFKASIMGGYLSLIIPSQEIDKLSCFTDEIANQLFLKLCEEIKKTITSDDIEFIMYKSFSFNNPSKDLIEDCFIYINAILSNKKSSNETTLYTILELLRKKYDTKELEKAFDTIFDILLDYHAIIKK